MPAVGNGFENDFGRKGDIRWNGKLKAGRSACGGLLEFKAVVSKDGILAAEFFVVHGSNIAADYADCTDDLRNPRNPRPF